MKHVGCQIFCCSLAILILGACSLRTPDSVSIRIQSAERESNRFGLTEFEFTPFGSNLASLKKLPSISDGAGFWSHVPCFYIEARSPQIPRYFTPGVFNTTPHDCSDSYKDFGVLTPLVSQATLIRNGVEITLPPGEAQIRLMGFYMEGLTPDGCSTVNLRDAFVNASAASIATAPAIYEYGSTRATVSKNAVVEIENSSYEPASESSTSGYYSNALYGCLNTTAKALAALCASSPDPHACSSITGDTVESPGDCADTGILGCGSVTIYTTPETCGWIPFGPPFFTCRPTVTQVTQVSCYTNGILTDSSTCRDTQTTSVVSQCHPYDENCAPSFVVKVKSSCSQLETHLIPNCMIDDTEELPVLCSDAPFPPPAGCPP